MRIVLSWFFQCKSNNREFFDSNKNLMIFQIEKCMYCEVKNWISSVDDFLIGSSFFFSDSPFGDPMGLSSSKRKLFSESLPSSQHLIESVRRFSEKLGMEAIYNNLWDQRRISATAGASKSARSIWVSHHRPTIERQWRLQVKYQICFIDRTRN